MVNKGDHVIKFLSTYYSSKNNPNRNLFNVVFKNYLEKDSTIIDDNFFNKFTDKPMTLLDAACLNGYSKLVECLLDMEIDPNKYNRHYKCCPLNFSMEFYQVKCMNILLKDPRTDIDVQNEFGYTILHQAVQRNNTELVKYLLDQKSSPNIPDFRYRTPLYLAVEKSNYNIINIIMMESKIPLDIDTFRDPMTKKTTRELLSEKYPDIELPPREQEQAITYHKLAYSFEINGEDNFLQDFYKIEKYKTRQLEELLSIGAKKNCLVAVDFLLKQLVNKKSLDDDDDDDDDGAVLDQAIINAVEQGHVEVLQAILMSELTNNNYDHLIMELTRKASDTFRLQDKLKSRAACLKMIITRLNVNCRDDKGNTPLHVAVYFNNKETIDVLLGQGGYINAKNNNGDTPLSKIQNQVLSRCLDKQLNVTNNIVDKQVFINYSFLNPHLKKFDNNSRRLPEMEPLKYLSDNPYYKSLLTHPIISSFVDLKWQKIKLINYINLFLYLIFHFNLNFYILTYFYEQKNNELFIKSWIFIKPLKIIYIILCLRELFHFLIAKFEYIKNFENLIDLLLYSLTGILLFRNFIYPAVVIILSTFKFIRIIGNFPTFAIKNLLFETVAKNILKMLLLHSNFLWSFSFAFFLIFGSQKLTDYSTIDLSDNTTDNAKINNNFDGILQSMFVTIIMAAGEFNANDIPFDTDPILSRCVFTLFIFIIVVILFNSLTGIVVANTDEIFGKTEILDIQHKINMISYIENIIFGYVKNDTISKSTLLHKIWWYCLLEIMSRRITLFKSSQAQDDVTVVIEPFGKYNFDYNKRPLSESVYRKIIPRIINNISNREDFKKHERNYTHDDYEIVKFINDEVLKKINNMEHNIDKLNKRFDKIEKFIYQEK
ncbi:hypothetical protein HCN44_009550 [Aphidius gifuensis]|uniref:Uncharacterized protein n=1 Tax=Aphidius gifuensis TaxID=684658 RepID=A0A834Y7L3_APHGI|nr:hypothetical protein HCN44_009550 [Aphidius gifuensis]